MDFQSLRENPSCIKLSTTLITILPLCFKKNICFSTCCFHLWLLWLWTSGASVMQFSVQQRLILLPAALCFSSSVSLNVVSVVYVSEVLFHVVGMLEAKMGIIVNIIRGGLCKYQTQNQVRLPLKVINMKSRNPFYTINHRTFVFSCSVVFHVEHFT